MMTKLKEMQTNAWQAFNSDAADASLRRPASGPLSKVVSVLFDEYQKLKFDNDRFDPVLRVLEFGSGNGERLDLVLESGIKVDWTGIDISSVLVDSAAKRHPTQTWIVGDAEFPEEVLGGLNSKSFDVCLFCHVLEMLDSQEMALKNAKLLSKVTVIEFFEPPNGTVQRSEIGLLPESKFPYLRHKIGQETYLTWLANADFENLKVHQTFGKYEVYVLS